MDPMHGPVVGFQLPVLFDELANAKGEFLPPNENLLPIRPGRYLQGGKLMRVHTWPMWLLLYKPDGNCACTKSRHGKSIRSSQSDGSLASRANSQQL